MKGYKDIMKPSKLLGIISSFFLRKPILVTWQCTYLCNLRCKMCSYWKLKINPKEEMSVYDYEISAPKVAKLGVRFVSLSGGEPFLRKDLHKIIEALSKYFFVAITSNGVSITRKMARKVARSGVSSVFVSLDFVSPEKHDEQRGSKGTYDEVMKSLEILREELYPGQTVGIMTVLSSRNLDEIEDLLLLARKLKVKIHIQPYSEAKTGNRAFIIPEGIQGTMEKIKRFKAKNGAVVSSYPFLNKFSQYTKSGVPNCRAGKYFFNIDSFGNIEKCVEDFPTGPVLANVKRDPFEKIKETLERLPQTSCTKCWYSCRGETETIFTDPILKVSDILGILYM